MEYLIPRLLSSFLTGVLLSQTGSFTQIATRNQLSSPSTLGLDGVSVLIVLLLYSSFLGLGIGPSTLMLFLLGLPVILLFSSVLASVMQGQSIPRLIFIGIVFNLLVGAVFSIWQFLFLAFNLPFPTELWFGHFRYAGAEGSVVLVVVEVFILLGWRYFRKDFYSLSLGSLGRVPSKKFYSFLFFSAGAGTFAVISFFGAFSFLGLVFPFIARSLWFRKRDLSGEFILGALVNGVLMMLTDAVCYYFPIYGAEVPVGLLATIVGAVSLILLLTMRDGRFDPLAKK
jgi:ABC-type Fe3+-siderophore transport system permease subunit